MEQFSIVSPARGSDYFISLRRQEPGTLATITAVFDTIGKIQHRHFEAHINDFETRLREGLNRISLSSIESLTEFAREELIRGNAEIRQMKGNNPAEVYGLCMVIGVTLNSQCRIFWLGDCRAYHLQQMAAPSSAAPAYQVKYLTDDHNSLNTTLKERPDFTLFRNELMELSKKLVCYWGAEEEVMRSILAGQPVSADLGADDAIILVTDGLYLPILRALVTLTNFKVTRQAFTLEETFRQLLAGGPFFDATSHRTKWKDYLNFLYQLSRDYTTQKTRYRDEIAAVILWPGSPGSR